MNRDEDAIQWEDAVSERGAELRIGHAQDDGTTEQSRAIVGEGDKIAFTETVDWPPNGDEWVYTSADVKKTTGITRYKLYDQSNKWRPPERPSVWQYILCFTTEKTYDYYFSDASNDCYRCDVFVTSRDHYVQYNSTDARIISVTGVP
ncbi:hypothetical protein [Streptomyces laurentii]|uniref:hypothetical protein n=1 Tax=Streptomyces laurentii TaxID=39478 RepID=UPI003409CD28